MSMQMIQEAPFINEGTAMPPPRKFMRRGSLELEDAVRVGDVKLSLPKQYWQSWISTDWDGRDEEMSDTGGQTSPKAPTSNQTSEAGEVTSSGAAVAHSSSSTVVGSSSGGPAKLCAPREDGKSAYHKQSSDHGSRAKQDLQLSARTDSRLPRFSDIIGHNAVKLRLDEVLLPLALPPAIADSILVGVRSLSASILLFGPPGCGKTQLAKAIAGEAEAAFLSVGPSDILSKFVGESEASIRSFFDKAYEQARLVETKCCVLFFDEIDALGQSRGGSQAGQVATNDPSSRRVLAELLIQLNKINTNQDKGATSRGTANADETSVCSSIDEHSEFESDDSQVQPSEKASTRIIVVAATNRPEDCDPALLRRFAVRVIVNLPSHRDRTKILKRYLANIHHTLSSTQLDSLSLETEGWTGSDLESLTREAAMAPVRECIRSAALLKRRNARMEQKGGSSTCQTSSNDRDMTRDDSQERILEQFENLRPVSVQDFEDAIAFWAYNQGNADPSSTTEAAESGSFNGQKIHYDSSSDEED